MRPSILYHTVSLSLLTSTTVTQSITSIKADLTTLANLLKWQGTTHSSYAPVLPAARKAHSSISSMTGPGSPIPQAAEYAEQLGRLVAESRYMVALSTPSRYRQTVLDSTVFLKGSLDEWRFTITRTRDKLEEPSKYRAPSCGKRRAKDISTSTPPGTIFHDFEGAPAMVVVPAGCFTAGSSPEEQTRWGVPQARRSFELPRRRVRIAKPLAVGRTEVTFGEFQDFIRQTDYEPRGGTRAWNHGKNTTLAFKSDLNFRNPAFPQTDDHPVDQHTGYHRKTNGSTPPAEAPTIPSSGAPTSPEQNQWANTYDTSSSTTNAFPWSHTNVTDSFAYTAPVASFRPNGFGLYDVTGNAREFTADDWIERLGGAASDGSVRKGPAPFPVVRGGAWNYQPMNLRLNYRSAYFSSEVSTNMFGFRLVRHLA
ncbi:sulfatase-modifying factor enzyme 1 domain-containing protein [Ophiocordyceps camponoti-floridani]|uniref:Sulfatase-modifying factor enzyme 1 domain-containing protein n=1 Tax=Ophiocordyceps camponoti-floridani TaxID=2030778 RepID=A0A8H4VCU0_9HYPO|nr:sulfatase-modifying factor enzyme 1 domain-containing protein [Ophiocordyceps camponoti-floridani]